MSMQDSDGHCSLQTPDAYQFITAADSQQRVACVACNVSDLSRMTTKCTQQSARLRSPYFHQMIISTLPPQPQHIKHSQQLKLQACSTGVQTSTWIELKGLGLKTC